MTVIAGRLMDVLSGLYPGLHPLSSYFPQVAHCINLFMSRAYFLLVCYSFQSLFPATDTGYGRGTQKSTRGVNVNSIEFHLAVATGSTCTHSEKKRNTRQHLKTTCSFYLHFLFFLLHVCWKRCLTLGALSFIPVNHVAGEWHAEMHNKPKWQWE